MCAIAERFYESPGAPVIDRTGRRLESLVDFTADDSQGERGAQYEGVAMRAKLPVEDLPDAGSVRPGVAPYQIGRGTSGEPEVGWIFHGLVYRARSDVE